MTVSHYQALFADAAAAGVHHLPHGPIDDLLAGAQAADCLILRVDLAPARGKEDRKSVV